MIDTHSHINFKDFSEDQADVIQRAYDAGVSLFINVGTDMKTSLESIALAESNSDIYATVGLHPHDASDFTDDLFQQFKDLTKNPKVVAIGEVGLDYFRNLSSKEEQLHCFEQFARLAKEVDLPLVIHCREAYEDVFSVLKKVDNTHRGIMHCFSGTKEDMQQALDLGLHISFAGPVTYKKNTELRECAASVPEDRLLTETDCPFLPPEPLRGKRNEPAWMLYTVKKIAEVRNAEIDKLKELILNNGKSLFQI